MNTRKIDKLGRIVLPKNYRKMLKIKQNELLNVDCDGASIIITPLRDLCKLCGGSIDVDGNMRICRGCAAKIQSISFFE